MKLVKFNDEYYLLNNKDLEIGQEYNDTVANWDGERWVVFKTYSLLPNFKEVIASTKEIEGLLKIRNLLYCKFNRRLRGIRNYGCFQKSNI